MIWHWRARSRLYRSHSLLITTRSIFRDLRVLHTLAPLGFVIQQCICRFRRELATFGDVRGCCCILVAVNICSLGLVTAVTSLRPAAVQSLLDFLRRHSVLRVAFCIFSAAWLWVRIMFRWSTKYVLLSSLFRCVSGLFFQASLHFGFQLLHRSELNMSWKNRLRSQKIVEIFQLLHEFRKSLQTYLKFVIFLTEFDERWL